MTLDEMIQETSIYIDETIQKTNNEYIGESLRTVNKLKSALNYAYKKIAREKYKLEYFETISGGSPLTKKFFRLVSLYVANTNEPVEYEVKGDNIYFDYNGQVDITYYYIPDDLVDLSDVPALPESSVDHKIMCFFAAFQYLTMEQDERASTWLNLWNDGFKSIMQPAKIMKTKNVYGW